MKKLYIAILFLLVCGVVLTADITSRSKILSPEGAVGTNQYGYELGRTVTTNDTGLAATTKSWATIGATFHPIPSQWSNITISLIGYGDGTLTGDPDGGSCDIAVYAARNFSGTQAVFTVNDAKVGKQQLSHDPLTGDAYRTSGAVDANHCYVDTATTVSLWPTSVFSADYAGADGQTTFHFDSLGCRGIYVLVTDITSLTSVTYVISGYGG